MTTTTTINYNAIANQDAALEMQKEDLVLSSETNAKDPITWVEVFLDDWEDVVMHNVDKELDILVKDILANEALILNDTVSPVDLFDLFVERPEEYEDDAEWNDIKQGIIEQIKIKRAEVKTNYIYSILTDNKYNDSVSAEWLKRMTITEMSARFPDTKIRTAPTLRPQGQRYYEVVNVVDNKKYNYRIITRYNGVESYDEVQEDINLKPADEAYANQVDTDEVLNITARNELSDLRADIQFAEKMSAVADINKARKAHYQQQEMLNKFRRLSANLDKFNHLRKEEEIKQRVAEKLQPWTYIFNLFVDAQQKALMIGGAMPSWKMYVDRAKAVFGIKYFTEKEYNHMPASIKKTCAHKVINMKEWDVVIYAPYSI